MNFDPGAPLQEQIAYSIQDVSRELEFIVANVREGGRKRWREKERERGLGGGVGGGGEGEGEGGRPRELRRDMGGGR